ncbi:DUF3857 domain-containing protein [Christiangramia forsetii]|uniref:DUF3857 domain-containing protein n=2 Tax=Christiangramia forsetii TaxID=411153 RepID=A0LZ45_CHRFK|nr:DUF3857 domain-containing protein [Christiangramia forsetii]GGG37407.1 hypothetical protein GCM10011532_21370 [Christiangramia forsetii]CAL65640.1 conserved hypothetical protein, secreted [Christiangramia forsetii KT0803]
MNKLTCTIFLLFSFLLNAQKPVFYTKAIIPSNSDLETTFYTKDSLANAAYLFEEGFSEIDEKRNYDLVTRYTAKIKIYNKEGLDEANITIPLRKSERDKERVLNLKASTYNLENGKKVKQNLNPDNVYTEEFENYNLKKFTFPDVKPGSVLVYSYELVSPFIFDFTTWEFQAYIPKAYSKFTAKIPANYEYYTTKRGSLKLKTNDARVIKECFQFGSSTTPADCVETVFEMEDIPAFKPEKFLTAERNYISRIEYELKQITRLDGYVEKYTKDWEDVDKELELDRNIGRQLKKDRLVDDLLPEAISSLPNNIEKAQQIYKYVQDEFNWNEEYNLYKDMNIRDVLDEKTGSVLEINSVLHNLFTSEGFEVLPVMSATRNKGFPSKVHPVLSDFNYFFIQLNLNGDKYVLDATEKNLDFGRLPYRALNGYARLIDFDKGSSWIDIEPKDYSRFIYKDSINIKPDGSSDGFSLQIADGYHALSYRNNIDDLDNNEVFNKLSNPIESTHLDNTSIFNKHDHSKNLEIKYSLNNGSQKINDKIYFNPFSFKFFDENPFKQENRSYPIDFGYKDAYVYSAIIEIPEGFKVTELPETRNLKIQGNAANLMLSAGQTGDRTISVQCRLTFKHAVYPPEYYEALKQFFDKIIEVQTQSLIVLEENS